MKKIILFILFGFPILLSGQTFSFSPSDTLESTHEVTDFSSEYLYVVNNSGGPITFDFELLSNTCVTNGWSNTLCTNLGCFPSVPNSGTLGTINDGSQGFFIYHLGFDGFTGTGALRIRVYENGNTSNADTLTYLYHAYNTTGLAETNNNTNLLVYPNPAINIINFKSLSCCSKNNRFMIYDLSGCEVLTGILSSENNQIDVSNLTSAVYTIQIITDKQTKLQTKFIKQ